jgi:hypothetical protein
MSVWKLISDNGQKRLCYASMEYSVDMTAENAFQPYWKHLGCDQSDRTFEQMPTSPILGIKDSSILSYPILSYPILSYPILSYPILMSTIGCGSFAQRAKTLKI